MSGRKNIIDLNDRYYKYRVKCEAKEKINNLKLRADTWILNRNEEAQIAENESHVEVIVPITLNAENSNETNENKCSVEKNSESVRSSSSEEIISDDDRDTNKSDNVVKNKTVPRLSDSELKEELAVWVVKSHISNSNSNELLSILKLAGHDLPADVRTLKKCPTNKNVVNMDVGSFVYFGIEKLVAKFSKEHELSKVFLTFNVDGLPLTKSTNSQIWPILAYASDITGEHISSVFAVAVYHGNSKPPINDFFREFVDELKVLIHKKKNGIEIKTRAFICDAPAKSFCTGTKNHNAYSGCSKCCQQGKYVENRVTFPEMG